MMEINSYIKDFSLFLNSTYKSILDRTKRIEKYNIALSDKIEAGYLQYNWETLVESLVCKNDEALVPYGNGADFDDSSSRVTFKSKHATMAVCVISRNSFDFVKQKNVCEASLEFNKLVLFKDGFFYEKPPFDFVHCEDAKGRVYIFKISDVDFVLKHL